MSRSRRRETGRDSVFLGLGIVGFSLRVSKVIKSSFFRVHCLRITRHPNPQSFNCDTIPRQGGASAVLGRVT